MIFAKTLIVLNVLIMGFVALSLATGPYSSFEQELWYRWYSIGFFIFGALLPAGLVFLAPRFAKKAGGALTVWLLISMVAFSIHVSFSGGGV